MKAAVEGLEQAQWKETQGQAKEVISSNIGPFGESVPGHSESEASSRGQQSKKKKKSKSKKRKGKGPVDNPDSGPVPVAPEPAVATGKQ